MVPTCVAAPHAEFDGTALAVAWLGYLSMSILDQVPSKPSPLDQETHQVPSLTPAGHASVAGPVLAQQVNGDQLHAADKHAATMSYCMYA